MKIFFKISSVHGNLLPTFFEVIKISGALRMLVIYSNFYLQTRETKNYCTMFNFNMEGMD